MLAFFFLPDAPGAAKSLTLEEQQAAPSMLSHDFGGSTSSRVEEEHFNWQQVRFALLKVNTNLISLNFFLILVPIYSYSLFLPTIIKGLGYKVVTAQLFTVTPNFLAFLAVLVFAWTSDRIKMRGLLIGVGLSLATIGYIMPLASHKSTIKYAGTFFVAVGAFTCSPLVLAWLSNNLAPHTIKATGLGFQVAVGNCGAFMATFTYLAQDGPDYITGHAILGAIGLSLLVTLGNIAYIRWENAARHSGKREYRLESVNPNQLGYRHPSFRYTT